jgi:hypothetical protein
VWKREIKTLTEEDPNLDDGGVSIWLRGANSVAIGAELRRGLVPKPQNVPQKYFFKKNKTNFCH